MKQKTHLTNTTRTCQNCKKDFSIEPDDFLFYEKIKVPPPTWCPECRLIRRLVSANELALYKRKCDFTGEQIFSMYDKDAPFPVYETSKWYSDEWDPYQYGMDYDFSKPFFQQFLELRNKVPKMALVRQGFSINSEYTHRVHNMKNSYMVFRASNSLDSMYIYNATNLTDCVDCYNISQCDLCYECIDCNKCYKTKFSKDSIECRDSMFLYACRNCSNCVGCVNLVNKEYFIFNKKYTKEEYLEKLKELKLNTFTGIKAMEIEFTKFRKKFPKRAIMSIKSENVSGDWFLNCKNVTQSFECRNVKDGKYLLGVFDAQDCMDYYQWGNNSELIYDSLNVGINSSRISFSTQCWMSAHDLLYCDSCPSSSYCFGCIGLKKGQYSILNKKYSKEEYEELVPKIIKHMNDMPFVDNRGIEYRFGEHFPDELSAFAYNETSVIYLYPISKEEALAKGYRWKDKEKRNYKTTKRSGELPETIQEVDDSILGEIIECAEKDSQYSTGAYRITQNELTFYRRMDLPLPRVCFNIRHKRRLEKRPPLRAIKRFCSKCKTEVETVYDENYAPIIYCERCYQQEVY
ncbi:hypothetical protein A2641_02260 [Candidatus Nomurabacteria bacterium RIFCSPHIGHO2_01_FULL_37_25]|uniref:Uncharacterized protein n=1 Tax=Candidatus Nomurabacteria bacterium RIFCSPLOWO2_01_FULL_36_16 TaxID=1801767 RepID=A0A1F6WY08_9BACT|nr:MAG: hypothetical protein A2641_02260 [Candidatus Nomurabacteria bacterium RIFCSPHIGHO2_01_FULL_37_25]OGI75813.1 MAG: hypothetical protein A3D36_00420 [Candidatus Nomurabacteria bacterium RIFCSPHIGHO2_02_FULL_36_29]OGI86753.1 MAG: hypothetical protein A3A91_01975 [Candidatus Nomurabacteria bacterium RIFCSPLOWO2_01_FULL_36_16]OGI96211.1 MAG: hypothetical protein A3I84_01975 [Candidatus Nomurabacteria bacterium RIFCSPLOWO2_02_FULL_36_8]